MTNYEVGMALFNTITMVTIKSNRLSIITLWMKESDYNNILECV